MEVILFQPVINQLIDYYEIRSLKTQNSIKDQILSTILQV